MSNRRKFIFQVDHPDHNSVQGALEAMRDVALLVNERKRRMECLEKIASWQITVEGWEVVKYIHKVYVLKQTSVRLKKK